MAITDRILGTMNKQKVLIAFFIFLVAGFHCEVINIGIEVGRALEKINEDILATKKTWMLLEPGILNENISYSEGLLIGLNSMVGTGNCLLIRTPKNITYDLHLGFSLLSVFIADVNILGKHMSAYFRVRSNSFNIRFTIPEEGGCDLDLERMEMIAAALVQNGSSQKEFDELQLDGFFQKAIVPKINEILIGFKPAVEKKLQNNCEALRRFDQNMDLSKFLY